MNSARTVCPACGSADVTFRKKRQHDVCEDCEHTFTLAQRFTPLRVFVSYGHDQYAVLARRPAQDLRTRGHEVWFDADRRRPGGDWETYIDEGLTWVADAGGRGRVVLLMTPHSVRRPDGYYLNEVARTLARGPNVGEFSYPAAGGRARTNRCSSRPHRLVHRGYSAPGRPGAVLPGVRPRK
jgi:hypothetical protein